MATNVYSLVQNLERTISPLGPLSSVNGLQDLMAFTADRISHTDEDNRMNEDEPFCHLWFPSSEF